MIRTGAGENQDRVLYQNMGSAVWNNDRDTIYLLDGDGAEVTRISYAC